MAANAQFLVGDALSAFSLKCNTSGLPSNQTITWLQTTNKTGIYLVQTDDRIKISNNGDTLTFSSLALIDEEYYGCSTFDSSTTKYKVINKYYVYVRGIQIWYKQHLNKKFD